MRPTIASLAAKVRRSMRRGPVGPDIGAMTHEERDAHLFGVAAQGMSAPGQDRETGLEAKPASPVGETDAPKTSRGIGNG